MAPQIETMRVWRRRFVRMEGADKTHNIHNLCHSKHASRARLNNCKVELWKQKSRARPPSKMSTWSCDKEAWTVSSTAGLTRAWSDIRPWPRPSGTRRAADLPHLSSEARFVLQNTAVRPSAISQKRMSREYPQKLKIEDVKAKLSCETTLTIRQFKMWKTKVSCENSFRNWKLNLFAVKLFYNESSLLWEFFAMRLLCCEASLMWDVFAMRLHFFAVRLLCCETSLLCFAMRLLCCEASLLWDFFAVRLLCCETSLLWDFASWRLCCEISLLRDFFAVRFLCFETPYRESLEHIDF